MRRVSKRLRADPHCTCGRTPYAPNEVAIRVAHEADPQGVADGRRLERFRAPPCLIAPWKRQGLINSVMAFLNGCGSFRWTSRPAMPGGNG